MATAELAPPRPENQVSKKPAEQRLVLRGVSWQRYRAIADALTGFQVRLTYDGEDLELMTKSVLHCSYSRLLARFVCVLTEELGKPICSLGDITCEREDLVRALEPDECFYIDNEPQVRGRDKLDFTTDPPPDLAVEVDISRSSLNRFGIYAKLGVPEVWRCDANTLEVYHLGPDGNYAKAERSLSFPELRPAEIADFLRQRTETEENSLMRAFRTWVREEVAKGGKKRPRKR